MSQQSKEKQSQPAAKSACGVPKFEAAEVLVREDIMQKAKHLAELICTTEEVKQYQEAEKLIQKHEHVQKTIAMLKKKQKEIVAFESFNNTAMVEKIEAELEALQDEIDNVPLVVQFQQSQTDVNYLLQLIMSVIRDSVSEKINVEAGRADDPETCSD
ncbi:RicAFT regulatory complex protein RicA family protein [Paenibacillus arenosi]|uniref:RicAFT regulatory complex protein RicA family protein n=1 Tax=Paenibacillus arenosi TaxID=2774142 RepID=UPI003080EF7A